MSDQKVVKLLTLLRDKTIHKEIKWSTTEDKNCFQTSMTNYSIRLYEIDNNFTNNAKYFMIKIINSDGRVIESYDDDEIAEILGNAYQLISETYAQARRMALGVDDALDEIIGDLLSFEQDIPF